MMDGKLKVERDRKVAAVTGSRQECHLMAHSRSSISGSSAFLVAEATVPDPVLGDEDLVGSGGKSLTWTLHTWNPGARMEDPRAL